MLVDLAAGELDRVHERIAGRFGRAEPRARVREYVSGLVAGLERKNGWTLAERAGEVSPDGMKRLLRRADWDVDGVRPAGPCTTPMRSPITPATGAAGPARPIWPGPPGAAGISRNASSRPRARPGSITTRSGPGGPGTPTSPCPCSPWPGSRPAGRRRKKGDRHQRPGHDRLHVTGDPPAADRPDPALFARPRPHLVLVHLAPKTPAPSPAMPPPATRTRTQLSAVAVLTVGVTNDDYVRIVALAASVTIGSEICDNFGRFTTKSV